MAEINETTSSSNEGIIDTIKNFVSSAIKKIAKTVKSAVTKILDMVENGLSGNLPKPETQQTTTPPSPAATTPTEETPIINPTSTTDAPTLEPEPPANDNVSQVVAQTEADETLQIKQKVKLVDGKLSDATRQTIKENLQGMSNPPTKEDVKHALAGIIQNAANNSRKKVAIPALGVSDNGLTEEESAEATLEALLENSDFTNQIEEILIYINNPEQKEAFKAAFSTNTTPATQAA